MTYVDQQTSAELRAHMRAIQKMRGWHNPLDDRLFREVEAQDAEIERLQELLRGVGANRYWEGRWRDAEFENARLRDALEQAIDDFGEGHCVCENTKQLCIKALDYEQGAVNLPFARTTMRLRSRDRHRTAALHVRITIISYESGQMNPFRKGDRVQYSDLGRNRFRFYRGKGPHGTVAAEPRSSNFVSVSWDGNKLSSTNVYSTDFIERAHGRQGEKSG